MAENVSHHALGDRAAFQLANVTKTPPQYGAITPRWLVRLLDWKPLEAGTLRVNRVVDDKAIDVVCGQKDEKAMPETYVEYEEKPREYTLSAISAVLDVQTRVSDLYSNPYDQVREQLRLMIENVKERQESELINNGDYGLLKNVPANQRNPDAQGCADAGRPRRVANQSLERAVVLSSASARDRRVWPRMHAPRRPPAHRHTFWDAIRHLARSAIDPDRQIAH